MQVMSLHWGGGGRREETGEKRERQSGRVEVMREEGRMEGERTEEREREGGSVDGKREKEERKER